MNFKRFNLQSALIAGVLATVIMTVFMALTGTNIVKMLGMTAGFSGMGVYFVGGMMHFGIGVFYALLYALVFEPLLKKLPNFLAGAVYSLLPFVIALTMMGTVMTMMHTIFGSQHKDMMNACNPCGQMEENPCNPCGGKEDNPCNPCNPCGGEMNPCNPRGGQTGEEMNPCNPCNPCGAGQGSAWLWSLLNHLVYGLSLGFFYRARKEQAA
ncbi:MAG: hypothetical protein HYS98_02505 [Deltaproteobacteria bacterium]|nr:hypothetical protein [Deltaproteobacteria bacterium]